MKKVLFSTGNMVKFIDPFYANFYGVPGEVEVKEVGSDKDYPNVDYFVAIEVPGVGIRKFASAFFQMAPSSQQ